VIRASTAQNIRFPSTQPQQAIFKRYQSGMSALQEAQNPQVGEGLEGKSVGGAEVIDGNAIAKYVSGLRYRDSKLT
jgi:hypothetical protein